MLPWVLLTAAALGVLLAGEARGSRAAKWVAKPLASAGFLGAACAAGASASPYGRVLLVALGLCWLGDVLLIPRDPRSFRAGLASFLLGHVALVAAFPLLGFDWRGALAAALLVVPTALLVLRWLQPHVPASFRTPVLAYVATISTMVVVAAATSAAGAGLAVLAGAVLFWVSDLAVARDRFVAPGFANKTWGLPLYYGATLVLASTAARAL